MLLSALNFDLGRQSPWLVSLVTLLNSSGNASFALYLTPPFVLSAVSKAALMLGVTRDAGVYAVMLVSVVVASAFGVAVYLLVEKNLVAQGFARFPTQPARKAL